MLVYREEALQHLDHEFHRGVVVIQQHDLVQRRLRGLWRCLFNGYAAVGTIRFSVLRHAKAAPSQNRSAAAALRSWKSNPLCRVGHVSDTSKCRQWATYGTK